MEKDVMALQELVADQAQNMDRLSDELYRQQKEIQMLSREIKVLKAERDNTKVEGEQNVYDPSQDRPPHY